MNHRKMTDDAFRSAVETLAKEAAVKHWQRKHPRCDQMDAWRFAEQNWRQFVEAAADILALWEALDGEEPMAPWN